MTERIKVKVGQVWAHKGMAGQYRVTWFESNNQNEFSVYASATDNDCGKEWYFGKVDQNYYPIGWDTGWNIVEELPNTIPAPKIVDTSDWRAWRHDNTNPGECVCGIRREMCDYHR